ncbi:hypothetical protein BGZ83_002047 [Gryganskiella cystojenkinii]|nr:hypothetical protein BGZ83_002047 [Gryganskiella cystojenkinii]
MVKLRVTVGGSYTDLAIVNCNDELHPIEFDAPNFKGRAMVRIKDFVGITNDGSEPTSNSDYFKGHHRRFSLQVEGRFKKEWDGTEVYFGTDFDRPVDLPDGFELMLKICRYIDPVVRAQLIKEPKPWVLSPIVSSINSMSAWLPHEAAAIPTPRQQRTPPATPRPMSMDLSRAFSMTEAGVASAWGFLGKMKRGNRSSVMSVSSSGSTGGGLDSYAASTNTSQEQLDATLNAGNAVEKSVGKTSRRQKSNGSSPGLQPITSPTTPQPGSLSSSPTTKLPPSAIALDNEEDKERPLGPWRQYVDEDTSFFLPNQPSLTTSQRRKHFQNEQNRKDFKFRTDLVHGFEFFSPHMDFNTFDIRLGLSMNVRKYLGGQPVRYICRTLDGETVFWAVQFELVE